MKLDYHLHTSLCGHATGDMRDYVEAALDKGLDQVGFSDHLPLLHMVDPSLTMSIEQLPGYVEAVLALREEFTGIEVKLGIEADYVPEAVAELGPLLSSYDFDYVYGAVHFLGDWVFDDPESASEYDKHDIDELYRQYFSVLGDAVQTGLFDILAHPDLIKKFDKRPGKDPGPLYESLLERVREKDMCYEINTAGLRWPVAEMYPERKFVEIAHSMGIPVTLGSDAHSPENVARDFEEAARLLISVGYREIATFEGRERVPAPLDW